MLVKVRDNYPGVFGCYDGALNTVTPKRAGDPPFLVDDRIAERLIRKGVLEAVKSSGNAPAGADAAKEARENTEEESADALGINAPEEDPDGQTEDLFDGMSINALRKEAKARGISTSGKNAETLRELIREHDAEDAPKLEAELPV